MENHFTDRLPELPVFSTVWRLAAVWGETKVGVTCPGHVWALSSPVSPSSLSRARGKLGQVTLSGQTLDREETERNPLLLANPGVEEKKYRVSLNDFEITRKKCFVC